MCTHSTVLPLTLMRCLREPHDHDSKKALLISIFITLIAGLHDQIMKYSETCLNQTFIAPIFVFTIDICLVYTS
jgi:hypothetical protein